MFIFPHVSPQTHQYSDTEKKTKALIVPHFLSIFHIIIENNPEILKLHSSKSIELIRESGS